MDKSLFLFIMVGVAFLYITPRFVGHLQQDDRLVSETQKEEMRYSNYITTDSIGETILDVTDADEKTQIAAWNKAPIKNEYLDLFPDFDTMALFIKNRVRGDYLVTKLTRQLESVENDFYAGKINAEEAKRRLKRLQ